MRTFTFDPNDPAWRGPDAVGAVALQDVRRDGRKLVAKGQRLTAEDLDALAAGRAEPLHVAQLDPDEVHEDDAARQLARALIGGATGIEQREPVQSRVNLVATRKGLLRVDRARIDAINALPGMAAFTLLDRLTVLPGKAVAGAKVTPVAVPEATLREAEAIAAGEPVVQVKPFRALPVGVVSTDGMDDRTRGRFQATLERKIGWYGGNLIGVADVPNEPGAVAAAIAGFLDRGAALILTGGGNTIDPLDATMQALPLTGADLVAYGAPAHPGSMFWLAHRGEVPIFNVASCSMYSKATVADLVLPWVMAGERVGAAEIAGLGYGGLLDRDMGFRFPPYDQESTEE